MRQLDNEFTVDPEPTEARRKHETQRRIEVKFERQCREMKREVAVRRAPIVLNPLADKLKEVRV